MRNFMQAPDIDYWRFIVARLILLTKTQYDGRKVTILEADYSDDD